MKPRSFVPIALICVLTATLSLPKSIAQGAAPARAKQSIVSIVRAPNDLSLSTLVESETSILPEQRTIIQQVLSLLTPSCQNRILNFYIRYDHPESRGLANGDTVIVSGNVPDDEFRALLVHEMLGHVQDVGCLAGTVQSGESEFADGGTPVYENDPSLLFYRISWSNSDAKKPRSKAADFISEYAHTSDPFEDLAESVTYFILHRQDFAHMTKSNTILAAKYAWIEHYMFPSAPSYAKSTYVWNSRSIPWDATKLPYEWFGHGDVALARGKR